jgi:F-type H+-transporting ATPase subunit a
MEIHASLRAEDLWILGPVKLTNSMVMAWITVLLLSIVGYFAGRNPQLVPRGAQNLFEMFLEGILTLVESTAGHYSRRVFPLIATLFIFILTANYLALLPGVGTISIANPHYPAGDGAHAAPAKVHATVPVAEAAETPPRTGTSTTAEAQEKHEPATVPLFRAANADVNMTLGMGLISFLFIHGSGMIVHGAWSYIKNDIAKPVFLTPIKITIEAFLPVSLSMRLFGNVFGGEMLLTVMNLPFAAIIFMFAELFFGFIQALIFSILTLIFTSLAVYVAPGHGHGEHGDAHGHGAADGHHEEHGHTDHPERAAAPAHA